MSQVTRRPRLAEVATLAHVSTTTVSRALRGDQRVRPETRKRIEAVASHYGFTLNAMASGLRSGSGPALLGLIVPEVEDPFFAAIAESIQSAANIESCDVLLGCHHNSSTQQDALVDQFASHRVAALLIVPAPGELPKQLQHEADFGTRVVLIDRPGRPPFADSVISDSRAGARELIGVLLEAGHKSFAVVSGPQNLWTQRERLVGIRELLAEAKISISEERVVEIDDSVVDPLGAVAAAIDDDVTAVIGLAVPPFIYAIRYALDSRQVQLACFDRHPLFDLVNAEFLCLEQDPELIGRAAVERVLTARADGDVPVTIRLPFRPPVRRGRGWPRHG